MMAIGISALILIVLLLVYLNSGGGGSDGGICPSGSGSEPAVTGSSKGGRNNPGYLIHTDIDWQGKTDSTGCKFENFSSLAYGIRAWYVNLFGKVKRGEIKNTNQMIDILTPAGKENSEVARNNYKQHVSQATSWLELGVAVFDFEGNPDWKNASGSDKQSALAWGLQQAIIYRYNGQVPQYFTH